MKSSFLIFFRTIYNLFAFSLLFCFVAKAQTPSEADSLKQLIDPAIQDTTQIRILSELGDLYYGSQPDTASLHYHIALEIAKEIDAPLAEAECLRAIGTVHQVKGAYDSALFYYSKARFMLEEIGDKDKTATCYNNIGYIYKLKGDYVNAIDYFYKALEIAEDLGQKRQMARTYNNIGSVQLSQGSVQRSSEAFEKALALYKELDYSFGIAICNVNLGINSFNEGDFNKSLEYHEKALEIHQEIDNKQGISICYVNMAEIYRNLGHIDKAVEYSLYSIELFQEMGYKEGLAAAFINVASLNNRLANSAELSEPKRISYLNKSLDNGNKALVLAREMNSFSLENAASEALLHTYKGLGNYKKALEFAELFIATKDSMFREEKINAILEIETKYETEKKQQQIELQEAQIMTQEAVIKQQKTYRNALGTGFLAVVLIIVIIIYAYVQKRRDNKKIVEQNDQILEANEELKVLNEAISKQNIEIIDSINYAERIQSAMLPPETYITELFNENFIFYKPRDIVSGDFYWIKQVNQYVVLVAADCTGHGVPGAFMSLLGISYLTEIVQRREITQANQVLNELRRQIKHSLRQHGQPDEAKDGIDIALCVFDLKNSMMQFAGANNPLYLIRDVDGEPELKEFKADRMPLGYYQGKDRAFTNHDIALEQGDTFYIFSDGFVDQKGGKDDKRYMSKRFKNTLLKIQDESMHDQKELLDQELSDWMGSNSQIDDILIIGVRV
ncbi:MAG: tetratricopeptide repeat protein [Bacteroidota bacterium]